MPPSAQTPSEQTPLLRSLSGQPRGNSTVIEDAITAAGVSEQGEGGPLQIPECAKSRVDSRGQLVVPDGERAESQDLIAFQANGKLNGVSDLRFRCVFGGILLGYFVSSACYNPNLESSQWD